MTITYRNATVEDVVSIVEIYNQTIPSRMVTADLEPVTVKQKLDWFHDHTPAHHPIWIFEKEGAVCGWLSFQPFHSRAAFGKTAEISFYVDEQYRGQGLGSHMLEKALVQSPALGILNLVCLIFGHNEPSIALAKKFGFNQWGVLPRVANLDGVERDLAILGKRLEE